MWVLGDVAMFASRLGPVAGLNGRRILLTPGGCGADRSTSASTSGTTNRCRRKPWPTSSKGCARLWNYSCSNYASTRRGIHEASTRTPDRQAEVGAVGMARPADMFDREVEWERLGRFLGDDTAGATLGVVSGRRRQGKSFLLEAACEQTGGMFVQAVESTAARATIPSPRTSPTNLASPSPPRPNSLSPMRNPVRCGPHQCTRMSAADWCRPFHMMATGLIFIRPKKGIFMPEIVNGIKIANLFDGTRDGTPYVVDRPAPPTGSERAEFLTYLKKGKIVMRAAGQSVDRLDESRGKRRSDHFSHRRRMGLERVHRLPSRRARTLPRTRVSRLSTRSQLQLRDADGRSGQACRASRPRRVI